MDISLRQHIWLLAIPLLLLLPLLLLTSKPHTGLASAATCESSVAEYNSYSLAYTLDIPVNSNFDNDLPPYSVDNTASIGNFDRIAYCLQLAGDGLPSQFVWVSMDAFTTVPEQVGVPVISTGATFQQVVSGMNVFSNNGDIVTGTGIGTGNIEFWHNCYARTTGLGTLGGSGSAYDFDDTLQTDRPNCYGSMQVHNYGAGQTLFAYNRWNNPSSADDLGIGNSPGHNDRDWTFKRNASDYSVRTLDILVTTDPVEAAVNKASDMQEVLDVLDDSDYQGDSKSKNKNRNNERWFTNQVDAVLDNIEAEMFADALDNANNILGKVNGCADGGSPDKNDKILNCDAQGEIHPLVIELIDLLEQLI